MKTLAELKAKYEPQGQNYQVRWIKLFREVYAIEEGGMCSLLQAKKAFERTNPDYILLRVKEHCKDPEGRSAELLYHWVLKNLTRYDNKLGYAIQGMREKFPNLTHDGQMARLLGSYPPSISWRGTELDPRTR